MLANLDKLYAVTILNVKEKSWKCTKNLLVLMLTKYQLISMGFLYK